MSTGHGEQVAERASHASASNDTKSNDPRVFRDLIDLLYAQSARGRYMPLIAFVATWLLFSEHAPWWTLAVVLGLQMLGTGISDYLRKLHRDLGPEGDRRRLADAYVVTSAICGASWGAAAVLWFVPGNVPLQSFLAVLLAGAITGSVVARSAYLPSLYAFVLTAGLPFVAMLVMSGATITMMIGALGLLYTANVLGWARGIRAVNKSEITARHRAEDLSLELEAARDEANRKATEAMEARRAAEAGDRAKSEFLATMTHEVRTPMNGIQGMAELLQETKLDETQADYLSVIRDSAESLRVILEDILELSRLEGGGDEIEEIAYSPRAVCEEVLRIVTPEAARKGLRIGLELSDSVPETVTGDQRRVRQVLVNLAGNAVKFTDKGRVCVLVSYDDALGKLRYQVRDTGIGIDPAILDRLFEMFTQGDQTATRRHGGRGLGLTLAKRLISHMGGEISVDSTPGNGSIFFEVPHRAVAGCGGAPSHNDKPRVDMGRLLALEGKIGASKTAEIVEAYLDTAWQMVEAIEVSRRAGDAEGVGRAAHDLKAAAGSIGLVTLADRAAAIQDAARAGRNEDALRHAENMGTEVASAHDALIKVYPAAMR